MAKRENVPPTIDTRPGQQVAVLRVGGGCVTITQSKYPLANTLVVPDKAVIDVMNLSDDEDTPLIPAPVRIAPVTKALALGKSDS